METEEKPKVVLAPVMVDRELARMAKEIAAGEEDTIQGVIDQELRRTLPRRYRRFIARRAELGGEG